MEPGMISGMRRGGGALSNIDWATGPSKVEDSL